MAPAHNLAPFIRPVAHRGLHDAARGIVENTWGAFDAAVAAGYAIECDLRPTADATPVVFHDATLDRLTGQAGRLDHLTMAALRALRLSGSGEPIPTYADLLDHVAGRVPLLVEIKSDWDPPSASFIAHITDRTLSAAGPVALMSFDPAVLHAVRARAPSLPIGIISGRYAPPGWWSDRLDESRRARLTALEETADLAPDFIAYCVDHLPQPAVTAARARGTPVFAWTVRTPEQKRRADDYADAPIFERPIEP